MREHPPKWNIKTLSQYFTRLFTKQDKQSIQTLGKLPINSGLHPQQLPQHSLIKNQPDNNTKQLAAYFRTLLFCPRFSNHMKKICFLSPSARVNRRFSPSSWKLYLAHHIMLFLHITSLLHEWLGIEQKHKKQQKLTILDLSYSKKTVFLPT